MPGLMSDMLQLVVKFGNTQSATFGQNRCSIVSHHNDKLKHVGHYRERRIRQGIIA
jgi:hypothetical protein